MNRSHRSTFSLPISRSFAGFALFVACLSLLIGAPETMAKKKVVTGYVRVWMAIVDPKTVYALTTDLPTDPTKPVYLFGPATANYSFPVYSEIPPGSYELYFTRGTGNGEVVLGHEKLDIKDQGFYTLLMRADSHGNPELVILDDTLAPDGSTPPTVHAYNFVSETALVITDDSGGSQTILPMSAPVDISNPKNLHSLFRSKEGDNINIHLNIDFNLGPTHSVVLIKDGYGDIFPRITNDGVIVK